VARVIEVAAATSARVGGVSAASTLRTTRERLPARTAATSFGVATLVRFLPTT
jgi:hypothetical protein